MKEKFQIKNKFGKVLFEYESENNTIKKTIEKAVQTDVDLSCADLSGADLTDANLERANLSYADLSGADLDYADLRNANLTDANLRNANLIQALLMSADLTSANLTEANLTDAFLDLTRLCNTDLKGADLKNVNLKGAYLRGAKNVPFIPLNLPEGEFIAYKKVYDDVVGYIVKLKILEDSKRSRATSDKCRCDKALVLEIQDIEGNKLDIAEITNYAYTKCTYKVGEIVYSDFWDENRWDECSHGIHFFLDRQSAVNY